MTMVRRSAIRLTTALLVVLSLLFSQLALANYICPPGAAEQAAAMVMEMAPGEPCEGMASKDDQPVLCFQHCTDAPQSFDGVKLPVVSVPALVHVLVIPLTLDSAKQEAQAFNTQYFEPPSDPVFLSTLRLRV